MTKVIEEYKRFTSDDKMMRAYAARDAFLLGQKMMLSRERKEGKLEGIKEGIEKGMQKGIKEGIEKGKLEGIKEGIEKGIKEGKISMAKTMKEDGADINLISKYTGLSIEEIEKL